MRKALSDPTLYVCPLAGAKTGDGKWSMVPLEYVNPTTRAITFYGRRIAPFETRGFVDPEERALFWKRVKYKDYPWLVLSYEYACRPCVRTPLWDGWQYQQNTIFMATVRQ